jgi:outer membrane lipoprotein SlyB
MITIGCNPRDRQPRHCLKMLAASLMLAGCTVASGPAATPRTVAPTSAVTYGTIKAIRVIDAKTGNPDKDILGVIGNALLGGVDPGANRRIECIVTTEDGRTISVVQRSSEGLRLGERVVILPGRPVRLAPAGASAGS